MNANQGTMRSASRRSPAQWQDALRSPAKKISQSRSSRSPASMNESQHSPLECTSRLKLSDRRNWRDQSPPSVFWKPSLGQQQQSPNERDWNQLPHSSAFCKIHTTGVRGDSRSPERGRSRSGSRSRIDGADNRSPRGNRISDRLSEILRELPQSFIEMWYFVMNSSGKRYPLTEQFMDIMQGHVESSLAVRDLAEPAKVQLTHLVIRHLMNEAQKLDISKPYFELIAPRKNNIVVSTKNGIPLECDVSYKIPEEIIDLYLRLDGSYKSCTLPHITADMMMKQCFHDFPDSRNIDVRQLHQHFVNEFYYQALKKALVSNTSPRNSPRRSSPRRNIPTQSSPMQSSSRQNHSQSSSPSRSENWPRSPGSGSPKPSSQRQMNPLKKSPRQSSSMSPWSPRRHTNEYNQRTPESLITRLPLSSNACDYCLQKRIEKYSTAKTVIPDMPDEFRFMLLMINEKRENGELSSFRKVISAYRAQMYSEVFQASWRRIPSARFEHAVLKYIKEASITNDFDAKNDVKWRDVLATSDILQRVPLYILELDVFMKSSSLPYSYILKALVVDLMAEAYKATNGKDADDKIKDSFNQIYTQQLQKVEEAALAERKEMAEKCCCAELRKTSTGTSPSKPASSRKSIGSSSPSPENWRSPSTKGPSSSSPISRSHPTAGSTAQAYSWYDAMARECGRSLQSTTVSTACDSDYKWECVNIYKAILCRVKALRMLSTEKPSIVDNIADYAETLAQHNVTEDIINSMKRLFNQESLYKIIYAPTSDLNKQTLTTTRSAWISFYTSLESIFNITVWKSKRLDSTSNMPEYILEDVVANAALGMEMTFHLPKNNAEYDTANSKKLMQLAIDLTSSPNASVGSKPEKAKMSDNLSLTYRLWMGAFLARQAFRAQMDENPQAKMEETLGALQERLDKLVDKVKQVAHQRLKEGLEDPFTLIADQTETYSEIQQTSREIVTKISALLLP